MPMGFGRPFRRFGPRLFPLAVGAALLAPRPRRMLRNANLLFEAGQFAQAAPMLENLSTLALQGKWPRAPFILTRAARAYALSGNAPHSVDLFRSGFEILAATGTVAMLFPAARRLILDLTESGHTAEAQEVKAMVASTTGWNESGAAPMGPAHPPLPTHCPQCGASLRSDEVEWIDEQTAECTYCGSPVR
jgi:hypothetical protein